MSAFVKVEHAADDLLQVDRLLNAAILASFAMRGDDSDAVAEVVGMARQAVKVAIGRLEQALDSKNELEGK